MSLALYRKWRPRQWDQVIGQQHIVQTLRNAVAHEGVRQAYLFAGPRGTGKTTTARLLAKAVNCLAPDPAERPDDRCEICEAINAGRFMDLIEIDAASNTSVDDVRDLRDKINFSPTQGRYKVYIIDEVHMLSTAAFNALLKTLEEPPPHAIFILATTEVHKIPATVLSRCQRHEFRRVPVAEIVTLLETMAKEEKLKVEPAALTLIARQATGSVRDAQSLLDQLSSVGGKITLELAQNVLGTAASQVVVELTAAILVRDAAAGLDQIHRALDAGTDPRQLARQMVDYLRNLLLVRMGGAALLDSTPEQRQAMAQQAAAFELPHLIETLRRFNDAATDLRAGWQPGLLLELAFAGAIQDQVPAAPTAAAPPPAEPPYVAPAHRARHSAPPPPAPAAEAPQAAPPAEETRAAPSAAPLTPPAPPAAAPEAAGTAPAEAEAHPPSGAVSFQALLQSWPRVKAVVKKARSQAEALLNSCEPMGIKDGALVLGFATELLKSKMEYDANLAVTEQALAQVLGGSLTVRCIVSGSRRGGKKGGKAHDDVPMDDDGMVAAALRDLGGEVVDFHE